MIKAVIIDDNTNAVELLRILLQQYCTNVQEVGSTSQPHLAAKLINDLQPDLVFLDVKMPGLSGFDVLVQLQNTAHQFEVIFTTAYDEFAIKAIKFSAFDYLLKPINPLELTASIERLENLKQLKPESNNKMIHFLENIQKENDNERSLALSDSTETIYIPLQHIIRLQA
ncbi:MAG: LytR/AlgR family response regulator transcription factor, partial [Chitinophagaceae bacterium]